jgi:hypothetical protein
VVAKSIITTRVKSKLMSLRVSASLLWETDGRRVIMTAALILVSLVFAAPAVEAWRDDHRIYPSYFSGAILAATGAVLLWKR